MRAASIRPICNRLQTRGHAFGLRRRRSRSISVLNRFGKWEERTMFRRNSFTALAFIGGLLAASPPAAAKLTTGTLTGSLKDAQGLVVPGAAVTLTSEARGTQLPPAFTNAQGDFVFANVPPDTYTIQVAMTGFKTLKRSGLGVSAGDHVGLGTLVLDIGGLTQSVTGQSAAPPVPAPSSQRAGSEQAAAVQ